MSNFLRSLFLSNSSSPILYEDPSGCYTAKFSFGLQGLQAQLFFLCCHTLFYFFSLVPLSHAVHGYFKKHKNYDQFAYLNKQWLLEGFGITGVGKEAAGFTGAYITTICLTQHSVGGLLCLPALCNYYGYTGLANYFGISPGLAIFMAKQGAMCEAGWELSDVIFRTYHKWILGDHVGQPDALVMTFFLHHIMGLSMVVPMCTFDGGNPYFIEGVFLLQFASGMGTVLQEFGYLLDIRKASDLCWMKIYVAINVIVQVYARAIRFLMLFYSIVGYYLFFGNYGMLFGSVFGAFFMGLFNAAVAGDAIKKTMKYLPMTSEGAAKQIGSKSS